MNESGGQEEKFDRKDERLAVPEGQREEAAQKEGDIVAERARRGIETPHIARAPANEPRNLSWGEARTKVDFRKTMEVFNQCFTDPADRDPPTSLARRFFNQSSKFILLKDGEKSIGMEDVRVNDHVPGAMYVPYAGVISDYRNQGIYKKMAEQTDAFMRANGKDHAVYEFEDKRALAQNVYPDENQDDVLRRIEGRQNFWKRSVDCTVVNDQEVPYCRPASDNPKDVQAYDSLAFRVLDKNDPKWNGVYNEEKTAISREAYEKFYLEIMQLEFSGKDRAATKDELRRDYPAIDQFFKQLEAHPEKKWVSIDATKPREKATLDANVTIDARSNDIEDRDRWKQVPSKGPAWEDPLRKS